MYYSMSACVMNVVGYILQYECMCYESQIIAWACVMDHILIANAYVMKYLLQYSSVITFVEFMFYRSYFSLNYKSHIVKIHASVISYML